MADGPGVQRHPWAKHGGFSLLRRVAAGTLDGRLREAVAIRTICQQLAADLGATWEDLPTAKRLIVEMVAVKATVLSLMASWAMARPVVDEKGNLRSPLGGHFLAWSNSLRLDLQALGLERRPKDVLDDLDAIRRRYATDGAER